MSLNKSTMLFVIFIASEFYVLITEASSYIICDNRSRSLDITPVLGSDYSVRTNMYQSTCLTVNEVTTPSYNYDFTFTDFSKKIEGGNNVEYSVKVALNFTCVSIIAKVDYKVERK